MGTRQPPRHPAGYFGAVARGSWSLVQGLGITLRNFFRPEVTVQYPEQREEMPDGYRGPVEFHDHEGHHSCTACGICSKICPTACLEPVTEVGEDKKRKLVAYWYEMSRCLFCGLCVESCTFGAIQMGHGYENTVYDRRELRRNLLGTLQPPLPKAKEPRAPKAPTGEGSDLAAAAGSPEATAAAADGSPAPVERKARRDKAAPAALVTSPEAPTPEQAADVAAAVPVLAKEEGR